MSGAARDSVLLSPKPKALPWPENFPFCTLFLQPEGKENFSLKHPGPQAASGRWQRTGTGITYSQLPIYRMCYPYHLHQLSASVQLAKINSNNKTGLQSCPSSDSMCTRATNRSQLNTEIGSGSAPNS